VINENILDSNNVYLFFRGTKTKQGYISKEYNLSHKGLSHVGIGVNYGDGFLIYHIVNSDKINNLEMSSINSFYNHRKKIIYKGIWEIQNIEANELKQILNEYENKVFNFDITFTGVDDNKLYCSELVVQILKDLDSVKFYFTKHKKALKEIHSTFLKKDTLEYFPADIFLTNKNFMKVYEQFKN